MVFIDCFLFIDNDGMMEVVVTNHQNGKKGVPPSLFAYHVVKPAIQPQAEQWVLTDRDINASPITEFMTNLKFHRYTLSSNFSVINRAFMSAAPGMPSPFAPSPPSFQVLTPI